MKLELNNIPFIITNKSVKDGIHIDDISVKWFKKIVDEPSIDEPFRPLGSTLTYPAEACYVDYRTGCWMRNVCSAKESFITFLQSKNIDIKEELYIIKL